MTRDTPQITTIESIHRADGTFVHVHLANGACFQSIVPNNDYRHILPIAQSLVAFALSSDVRMTRHRRRQAKQHDKEASELLNDLYGRGVELKVVGDTIKYRPQRLLTDDDLARMKRLKPALLLLLTDLDYITDTNYRQAQGDYRAYRGRMVRADEVPLDDR